MDEMQYVIFAGSLVTSTSISYLLGQVAPSILNFSSPSFISMEI